MKFTYFIILSVIFTTISCKKEEPVQNRTKWSIPQEEVFDGGPGKDGIPSIDHPEFVAISEINYVKENDLVIGMIVDGQQRAYPHPILDWHEIVNDKFQNLNYGLTYCPLTGTAIAWDANINNKITTFGVSGKLYNNNLMPYDRLTDSYWSQLKLRCVNGELLDRVAKVIPTLETTWKTWKNMYPNSKVMSKNTGYNRNYNSYPYGSYRTNHNYIIFPNSITDTRLPSKERVLGVLHENRKIVYRLNTFDTLNIINDKLGNDEIIVIGSKLHNFIVAFNRGPIKDLIVDLSKLPIIGKDKNGNELDISGRIITGPNQGIQLEQPVSFMGYWFSFGAFHKNIEIYK